MAEGEVESQQAVLPEEPAERVRALLERVLEELGLEATVSVEEDDEEIHADVDGEDVGLLIGRHGQTIDALQLLCYQAAFRGRQDRKRVSVDAAGYRERQSESLQRRADMAAEDAIRHQEAVEMDPMGSNERRVVHEHLRDRPEVETYSEGDEPNRYVVVAPLVEGSSVPAD
ncbi:MAG TPA: RNA-binding cell elongation regulator Jag/EloR [Solirubrobacterales bacterium]